MPRLRVNGVYYPIRAILFDKDGTLLDFIYTWGRWGERLLARFSAGLRARGLPPLPEDLSALWGTVHAEDGAITDYDRNGPLSMGTIGDLMSILTWHGYRNGLSWAEAKLLAEACRQDADDSLAQSRAAKALPHAIEFLTQCRDSGIALAIVTADETAQAVQQLEWLGIRGHFSAVVGTDRVDRGKPFPDMVALACRELGVASGEAAVIGDTNGDMRMAKSAGAAVAIGIAGPDAAEASKLSEADAVIASYLALAAEADE
ncbi:HAD family hydrolase [Cohnella nanjingensis]|uniref:HAD family hydrolase n=1 Tax=Cohnella nanjingensis TaxID=1387779 RepID=A0A7X0RVY5_9BACL|nr:HAD family hydrolase [Cohnella nanjingensis]MBB6674643.1 HAD family hydrolase [Cohnella nanjingensis]